MGSIPNCFTKFVVVELCKDFQHSLTLVVVPYLLHEAVVAYHAPRRPLERGYRRRSQLVPVPGDEVLLPLRVAGAEDVHVRRHAALVVEAHVLDLLQDLREELDVEVL